MRGRMRFRTFVLLTLVAGMMIPGTGKAITDEAIFRNFRFNFVNPGGRALGLAGAFIAATVRIYQVFPFDFSAYEFPWETLTRAILIIAIVGAAISIIVETVRLAVALRRAGYSPDPTP